MERSYAIEVNDLCKSFSGVPVLQGVGLAVLPGELHALMGENGAGKSTLMKIIMGIYKRDAGSIRLGGVEVSFQSAREALHAGISMIHQELSPIPEMTVAENIFLGREEKLIKGLPFVHKRENEKKTQSLLMEYGLFDYIQPNRKMKELNIAQIQMMEIVKAVSYASRVIIMDEPTSSLSDKETEILFKIIQDLKKRGVGIIYISHRMEEIFRLADRVSVLRDGRLTGCSKTAEVSKEDLIHQMVGRALQGGYPENKAEAGEKILEVKSLTRSGVFEDISFFVRSGEILGIAGLVGSGRSEVMRALVGFDPPDGGGIFLEGKRLRIRHPWDAIRNHIVMASEDRKSLGLILQRTIRENISIQNLKKMSIKGFIKKRKEAVLCREYADRLSTKMNGIDDIVAGLSGGNQQKIVLAKCLLSGPKVLIMDEPTRGIDIGAKAKIYELMVEMAKKGIAIIMISSEMPELIGMSSRVLVMSRGRITGELIGEEIRSQHKIMRLALGEWEDGKRH